MYTKANASIFELSVFFFLGRVIRVFNMIPSKISLKYFATNIQHHSFLHLDD